MKKTVSAIMLTLLLIGMGILSGFLVVEVSAEGAEVKFRGVVITNEKWEEWVCYGSYRCYVRVKEILYDPNGTLYLVDSVSVAYRTQLNLTVGDRVECYGRYWVLGACPLQYLGHCQCFGDSYYIAVLPPVGGYSFPIQVHTKTEPVLPYIALVVALTAIFTKLRPKTKRKR